MPKKLITAPSAEPVTLLEAKDHLRQPPAEDDNYVTGLIVACRMLVEKLTERALMAQTWDVFFDEFPRYSRHPRDVAYYDFGFSHFPSHADPRDRELHQFLELGPSPLQSVTSLTYVDANGATQTLDPALYQVDAVTEPARIYPVYGQAWPGARRQRNAIAVRIITGYADAASVPDTLKLAIKMLVANYYENREPVALIAGTQPYELPIGVRNLIYPERTADSWV